MSNFKEKGFFKSICSLSKAKEQNEEKTKETKQKLSKMNQGRII
ncbi:hypothetical protein [Clostridium saccharobutylicum]|nr:hypothetical protein [Clostridium saccharobutylicum]MBA8980839.1 hypothetical protein [Clostridium saccharobutylicum]